MSTYTVFRFSSNGDYYKLQDDFSGTEISAIKYYLIETGDADVTMGFEFNTYMLTHTYVDIYEGPTVSTLGRQLSGVSFGTMYADPLVLTDGRWIDTADPDSSAIDIYYESFAADDVYLLKITPKDLIENATIIS
jgi:hypothetical protein